MSHNKRSKILMFFLLLVLSILIRFPVIPHELGTDSFVNHEIINEITKNGGPVWIPHPLVLFGFGDNLNMEITISGISQLTGLDVEKSIFLYSLIIGIIGIMGFFILIYFVTKDFALAYVSSLLLSIAPEFIRLTIWTASSRSLLIALIPFLLFFIFRNLDFGDKSFGNRSVLNNIFILIFLLILMGSHNLIFFVFIMVFAIVISLILTKFKVTISINEKQLNFLYIFVLFFISFLSSILFKVGPYESNLNFWSKYSTGLFFKGEDAMTLFFNMAINYTNKIGFLLFFAIIGIIYLFNKNKLTIFDKFCLIFILMLSPLLGVGTYVPLILMLPLIYIIATGLMELNKSLIKVDRPKYLLIKNNMFTILIICGIIFSIFINFHWELWGTKNIDDIQYSKETSNFIKEYGNGTYIPNQRSFAYRWTAYSEVSYKPSSYYGKNNNNYIPFINFDMSLIKSGKPLNMVQYKRISNNIDPNQIITGDLWYGVTYIWSEKINKQKSNFESQNIKYTIQTNIDEYANSYVNNMVFFKDVRSNGKKIFDVGVEEMWHI